MENGQRERLPQIISRTHIHLIKWPGNSPDLNPIENIWAWMKHQLMVVHPTNLQELQQETTRLWVLKMDDSPYIRRWWSPSPKGCRS
jgi:transposase